MSTTPAIPLPKPAASKEIVAQEKSGQSASSSGVWKEVSDPSLSTRSFTQEIGKAAAAGCEETAAAVST